MEQTYNSIIHFIQNYFEETGGKGAVIGISGGKDSTIVAKLLVDALGKENVLGVLLPNGVQDDICDSHKVCDILDIRSVEINISKQYSTTLTALRPLRSIVNEKFSPVDTYPISMPSRVNILPRLRMLNLYAIAQTLGYRVAGTGNKSEQHIGWCTKWGDMACDFNPIAHLTCTKVIELGDYMGLPNELVHKAPADGLTDKTDEDNLGFSYIQLDNILMGNQFSQNEITVKIIDRFNNSRHKFTPITIENYASKSNK